MELPTKEQLDKLEALAKAARDFQPESPSDGWPGEPEVAPPWSASGGWLEDGGHAAFARQHEYSDEAESDGADADAAFIAALSPEVALSLIAAARELEELKSGKLPERNAEGLRVVWDWPPWARFLAARAAVIHEALAEGKSPAYIRDWLSMDEVQVRLIGATELRNIPGTPGAVWPPAEFQEPTNGR